MSAHPEITVALLGAGTVGAQVARLLTASATDLQARVGAPLRLTAVAVRDTNVVRDAWLPADLAPTDLLAVAATGAYCRSMASNYNLVPRPPVVSVLDGASQVVLRRETMDDLLAMDVGV